MRWTLCAVLGLLACTEAVDRTVPGRPLDPGRVTFRRLNNSEYSNTIRDLLYTDQRPGERLPTDDVAHGWDHMADALTLSPLHIELYEQTATELVQSELGDPIVPEREWFFQAEGDQVTASTGGGFGEGWNLWSNGTVLADVRLDHAGRYRLSATLAATQGGPDLARAALVIDERDVRVVEVPGNRVYDTFEVEVELAPGVHSVGVAFLNDYYDADLGADRNLLVDSFGLVGPIGASGEPSTARERWFTCDPDLDGEDPCARQILVDFASAAWRRPIDAEGQAWLLDLYAAARDLDADWETSVQTALIGTLLSPRFLFRMELDPDPTSATARPLDGYEMASRLSYFLWRSPPDQVLYQLAADERLQDPTVLEDQVRRMLADPRAETVITDYAGQWLAARAVDDIEPDYATFPDFDQELRTSMRGELDRFAASILLDDRSMLELLTAETTFVDARLAEHYGVEGPSGSGFVEVTVDEGSRVGLLTKAGLLSALSLPKRTSPVKRGKWVMSNLLCEAPPPAPANIEPLEESDAGEVSLRERMEQHRADPACATCHRVMDPIGFSMEHFDAIGAFRLQDDEGFDVDSSGTWPGGPVFDDVNELQAALAQDPRVPTCMTRTTFAYALARPPGVSDIPYLDDIEADFAAGGHTFESLAIAIVLSEPFRTRRGEPAGEAE